MLSYQYRHSHVKDKTVSPTVLSLTWESPYLGKTVFILRRGPASTRLIPVKTRIIFIYWKAYFIYCHMSNLGCRRYMSMRYMNSIGCFCVHTRNVIHLFLWSLLFYGDGDRGTSLPACGQMAAVLLTPFTKNVFCHLSNNCFILKRLNLGFRVQPTFSVPFGSA